MSWGRKNAPSLALDVLQDLAQGQPTQLKGFLDSEDGDLSCSFSRIKRLLLVERLKHGTGTGRSWSCAE